jgi:MFS transporter, ACS family, solute carrier family 17 (sodium-dependent inorganic phosphate cotransporter), other
MTQSASVSPGPADRGPWFGVRHSIVLLCFVAVVVGYTDRVNISVASVAMRDALGWSQTTKGIVLSAFFFGYMLFLPVAGWLATRIGGRRLLGASILAWSVFTLLTPLAAETSLTLLIAARVAMGMAEASMFPAAFQLCSHWIPLHERTSAVVRILSGVAIGTVIGLVGSGWLVSQFEWPSAFYFFGLVGVVLTAGWFAWVRDTPAESRQVGEAERRVIASGQPAAAEDPGPVPWRLLLSKPAMWALLITHFAANWVLYFALAWLPSYFRDAQGLSITNAGLFSAAPWVAAAIVTNLAGVVSDHFIRRGVAVVTMRKVMQSIGLLGPAVFLLLARDASSPDMALVLLCCAVGTLGCTWAGYAPNIIDVAPRHTAAVAGVSNSLGTLPGVVGVALMGWLVDVTGTYAAGFLLTASVAIVGAVVFIVFGRSDPIAR